MVANKEILGSVGGEKRQNELKGNPNYIGVALAIIGIDPGRNGENITHPKLWTVRELRTKESTEKIAGQLSFPSETRKQTQSGEKEDTMSSIIGTLVDEFSDEESLIEGSLFLVKDRSIITNSLSVKKGPLDLVVVIYSGPLNRRVQPTDSTDVQANGWMSLDDLEKLDPVNLRSFVSQAVWLERSTHVISNAVEDYLKSPFSRIPVASILPKMFSISTFRAQREQGIDVVRDQGSLQNNAVLFERP